MSIIDFIKEKWCNAEKFNLINDIAKHVREKETNYPPIKDLKNILRFKNENQAIEENIIRHIRWYKIITNQ